MRLFDNKLSRINFLILIGILTYLYANMSNEDAYVEAILKASPSVINISSKKNNGTRLFNGGAKNAVVGSGIIISNDGYIITNLHVIEGTRIVEVEMDSGQVYPASLIGFDQRSDLAVIKINPEVNLTPIEVSNSASVQVGDQVIAIGNAFGLGKTFTSGIISATGRDYGNPYLELIQTDAAINPGNSGGALIDSEGRLIGINTLIRSSSGGSEGIGLAIPSTIALEIISDLIQYGEVRRGWLGFSIDRQSLIRNGRLVISEVVKGGPAYLGGLQKDDSLSSINSEVATYENLYKTFARSKPGEKVFLTVERNSKLEDITLTAGKAD